MTVTELWSCKRKEITVQV